MKSNWKEFCKRIIKTNGNPSTKDAEECGISFNYWLRIATYPNMTKEKLIHAANKYLKGEQT